ncbi:MAG: ribose-phosphate diphosphokinase [Anaerolineales bacterium]
MKEQALRMKRSTFLTPDQFAREQIAVGVESPRGRLLIAGCRSGTYLAGEVAHRYQVLLEKAGDTSEVLYLPDLDDHFSDTETRVRLEAGVSGYDVFLFQALYDPLSRRTVDQNYMAFLIAARAFREYGANHVTAVLPYLAYARQDKPTRFEREPTTAQLMADLGLEAGIDRLVTWHPHSRQTPGFYGKQPVDTLPALLLFIAEFRRFRGREEVIAVAPDAGASKLITYFGRAMGLDTAIASKYRPRPEEAVVAEIMGDFRGKRVAIILDDMISSGGTLEAAVKKLVEEQGIGELHVGVSHNLCMPQARERLETLHAGYHLHSLVVTNSIPQTESFLDLPFLEVRSLADVLARAINRIHYHRAVSELFEELEEALQ